jgi:hypothetical protein
MQFRQREDRENEFDSGYVQSRNDHICELGFSSDQAILRSVFCRQPDYGAPYGKSERFHVSVVRVYELEAQERHDLI